jgi:predicted RNA-binding Zn ribbon-like protein
MSAEATTSAPLLGEPLPVEFMNTIWADRTGVHDALATDTDVLAWIAATPTSPGLADDQRRRWLAAAPAGEVAQTADRLRELRDALRRLAAAQTADPRERAASVLSDVPTALGVVNSAAASAPHWSHLQWRGDGDPHRQTRTEAVPGNAVTAAIAEAAIDLFASETRSELRACLAPGCVLYFVKQHARREWCSAGCGNRARVARHYQRHRSGA